MSTFSDELVRSPVGHTPDSTRRKQQAQQPRQLLSCTKCRERKVKCDRTKPCSACCARGSPKECHFVAEGGDYAPIQQSYELRKLRAENLRLKERLRASRISLEDDESDQSSESQLGDRSRASSARRRAARQKRFQGPEWSDSIYFGSPGLASVIADFATVNLTPAHAQTLTHLTSRGPEMYTPKAPSSYPFATLFPASSEQCIPQLLAILPARRELFGYLSAFEKRVCVCAFPHLPIELTKTEIERFLADAERNARICPDMLALIFAAIALGAQHSAWYKSSEEQKAELVDVEAQRGNVYIAASMQALRVSSFMSKPSLLAIEALIMMGPFLTNSGRLLDAWTLFGTTIRLAQAIGLHRHPKFLDPAPPTQRECSVRQTLWWWMLHMDEQYSITLGRPLGISGIGDCPPPHELTTDPRMLRFGEFTNHFTVLARQILSSDRLTDVKIDEFTDLLNALLDTMPEMLQFDESWLDEEKELPEWPLSAMAAVYYCKTHTYLILLNRQRIDRKSDTTPVAANKAASSFRPVGRTTPAQSPPVALARTSSRGRLLVLTSSQGILTAFLFFYTRAPAALVSWDISQQAFNSSMILLLDALETGNLTHLRKVEQAYVIFRELQQNGVHQLAGLAVEKLSWGLDRLHKNMEASRTLHSSGKIELERAAQHGVSRVTGLLHDTVMGNTGMLLLEGVGLQSYTREQFEPFTWADGRPGSAATTPSQLKQEQTTAYYLEADQSIRTRVESSSENGLASHDLQGNTRPPQDPAMKHYCTPSLQQIYQPQSCETSPASPMSPTPPDPQQGRGNEPTSTGHLLSQGKPLPHAKHVGSCKTTSPVLGNRASRDYGVDGTGTKEFSQHRTQAASTAKQYQISAAHLRHNSCPSLEQLTKTPPLLRPTYSSPLTDSGHIPTGMDNEPYSMHTHWWANPSALNSLASGTMHSPAPLSVQDQDLDESARPQSINQRPLPAQTTVASANAFTATEREQITVDRWKMWVETQGAG